MSSVPVNFLLVDDLEENLLALEALLRRDGLQLFKALSGSAALELLLRHEFALAIIDVQMPEMDGFELAEFMRGTDRTRRVPIIFLTAGALDLQRRFRGYEAGAVDFLFKPVESHVLKSKADVFFELDRQRQELAQQRDELQVTSRELAAAKEKADAANLAKDRFLAVLSHELRTPLSPVLMTVSSLENDSRLPKDVRDGMSMIHRNVQLEARLIDDLLDLSRVLNGKLPLSLQSVNIHTVVSHAIETCAEELKKKEIRLTQFLRAADDRLLADPGRLQQVLWNLLKNAIKFTPAGGKIAINSENVGGDHVLVSVEDNGIGIPAASLALIFDAFEQADAEVTRTYGGLGLGLAICKGIVESHGGVITAASQGPGTGTCIKVKLPLSPAAEDEAQNGAPSGGEPSPAQQRSSLRILLVEDHVDTANVLRKTLQRNGYEVEVAHSVKGALALATSRSFDILVSDVGLPDASGYDLMREIRERYGTHGIAMSGYGAEEDLQRSREAGFVEHLVKPVNIRQLEEAIRRVMQGRH
jgi:signal transduction histidine kinase